MYLSSKQHDQLQIIVTGFEIPYRSYVATEIINRFPTEAAYTADASGRTAISSTKPNYQMINSELGKLKANPAHCYQLLMNAKKAKDTGIVIDEISVPNVGTLISLTIIYKELFSPLFLKYRDEDTFLEQALKYKYVRNKLDHRGCKTLETADMVISLDFVANALLFLGNDSALFWEKSCDTITKEVKALQTSVVPIPIAIQNLHEMPFPDMKIVCRDKEIQEIKEFVYGRAGALRKQVSYVLFGYGGVGKTALVLEAIKQIIQDLQDGTVINNYSPEFILFFSAKDESLSFSNTTGKIQKIPSRVSFKTADELICNIFEALNIPSFLDYGKTGLIIIDNLESLSSDERKKVEDFIRFSSPQQVQYILTSRNEENYECRKKLAGFDDDFAGRGFIDKYISENNYDLTLTDSEIQTLLQIAMGNTLVLVLCLRRLSLNLTTISGIASDMTAPATIKKLEKEIRQIPANGFNIISEYMFKNSFQEIQDNFKSNQGVLTAVLKIFAVYPADAIDLYTISMLSKQPYSVIDPILELLCRYLIVEKIGETYRLNQFAEKYIIQLFMPDSETYEKIQTEIVVSTRRIQEELRELQDNIERNESLKQIIQDWNVISDGDKIAAAKAYKLFGNVYNDCKTGNRFHISSALSEAVTLIATLEQNTMHPYVKFQKARILHLIASTRLLDQDFTDQIVQAYNDTIWTIKANPIYSVIKGTKSYASILWKYGIQLSKNTTSDGCQSAIRYLEESKLVFEQINDNSEEYYQCMILLGKDYLRLYLLNRDENVQYLRKARSVSNQLYQEKYNYCGKTKTNAIKLRNEIKKYGQF